MLEESDLSWKALASIMLTSNFYPYMAPDISNNEFGSNTSVVGQIGLMNINDTLSRVTALKETLHNSHI